MKKTFFFYKKIEKHFLKNKQTKNISHAGREEMDDVPEVTAVCLFFYFDSVIGKVSIDVFYQ